MRLLFVVQHFRQGWGGAPESVRQMARLLRSAGISSDVVDADRFHPAVEMIDLLPERGAPAIPFDIDSVRDYDAVAIVGPWQRANTIWRVLRHARAGRPLIYLPRGGLGEIEFSRLRDLKKWPYLSLIEKRWIRASTAAVYSSRCEQEATVRLARRLSREVIIPDFFSALSPGTGEVREMSDPRITLAFMAEIAPRKGLLQLVEAYAAFCMECRCRDDVRLLVAGSVRKGSEAYYRRVVGLAKRYSDIAPIEFVGPVAHAERPAFYAATDIFVVPSLFESYCLTVLEALAGGCAVVTAPNLGVLEFLPEHNRLSIAASSQPHGLAAAIKVQYEQFKRTAGERSRTVDYATAATHAINSAALAAWRELLG